VPASLKLGFPLIQLRLQPRAYRLPQQPALAIFRFRVGWYWHRSLSRRSQNGHVLWDRMRRLITRWLPLPAVCHPYPLRRLGGIT
jgi:hypothetical protein